MNRGASHLLLMVVTGVPAGILAAVLSAGPVAPVIGWGTACAAYVLHIYLTTRRLDATGTRAHALEADPSRHFTEAAMVLATVASFGAVGYMLVAQADTHTAERVRALLAVGSVACSWIMIHTLYTLRYAGAYYSGPAGGVDFNTEDPPRYGDFAYMAFTVGMTYQIADTNLQSSRLRSLTLRHGLLSYLFGTVILVTAINLGANFVR
ncbi:MULTISPECIES: DUF1345 domain-containing protein [Aeromicrobium]|nr:MULTISPECIES: DUF1345 domain-containing protein [Aeromicrobium]